MNSAFFLDPTTLSLYAEFYAVTNEQRESECDQNAKSDGIEALRSDSRKAFPGTNNYDFMLSDWFLPPKVRLWIVVYSGSSGDEAPMFEADVEIKTDSTSLSQRRQITLEPIRTVPRIALFQPDLETEITSREPTASSFRTSVGYLLVNEISVKYSVANLATADDYEIRLIAWHPNNSTEVLEAHPLEIQKSFGQAIFNFAPTNLILLGVGEICSQRIELGIYRGSTLVVRRWL